MGLYTIGHSSHPVDLFIELLHVHSIDTVLDVRSTPYSRFAPQFNEDRLSLELEDQGIKYYAAGKPFGARQRNVMLYPNGYLDFELARSTALFKKGVEHTLKRIGDGENVALMCTEKHPIDCHRAIMVARGFELAGVDVQHILPDAELMDSATLNERLLDQWFPDRQQMSLFSSTKDDDMLLEEAYRYQNRQIGYRLDQQNGGR